MITSEIDNCCALTLLSGFGNTLSSYYEDSNIKKIKDFIKTQISINYGSKILIIYLNNVQLSKFGEDLFINLGFKIIPLGYYSGHSNNIFMLFYNPNENP